jgi:hypothetical protein
MRACIVRPATGVYPYQKTPMQKFTMSKDAPANADFGNAIYHDGKFWWKESHREPSGPNTWREKTTVRTSDGLERKITVTDSTYFHGFVMVNNRVCLDCYNQPTVIDAEKDVIIPLDIPDYPNTPGHYDRAAMLSWETMKAKAVEHPWRVRANNKRNDYDDIHVVMTGMEAISVAPLVMGPSHAESITKTKGIKSGHIVMYRRGGGYRVMKLEKGDNPLEIVMADDGLTVGAMCRKAFYILDVDAGE